VVSDAKEFDMFAFVNLLEKINKSMIQYQEQKIDDSEFYVNDYLENILEDDSFELETGEDLAYLFEVLCMASSFTSRFRTIVGSQLGEAMLNEMLDEAEED